MEKEVKILEGICDSLFKKNIFDKESSAAYCNLLPLLVDCILQQGMNYNTFVIPRINRIENEYSHLTNISQVPIEPNFINDLLNVKNKRKINMFISILELLRIEKIENINSFYSWIKNYKNQQKLLAINGLGQKTLDYILNLLGIESIPVDRHIYKFLNICGIYTNKYEEASTIINFTAEKNGYNKIIMDKEIWHYMKTITI